MYLTSVHVDVLLDCLVEAAEPIDWAKIRGHGVSGSTEVCMNHRGVCSTCIFHEGRLARWCLAEERKAKEALIV